jgi:nucleotide-binding universal stress UspA family protein
MESRSGTSLATVAATRIATGEEGNNGKSPGSDQMNIRKIVVPVDFSGANDAALKLATALARDGGGSLLILHVEQPPIGYGGGDMGMLEGPHAGLDLQSLLEQVRPTDPNVKYEHHLVVGDPAREIVRLAADEDADLIVIGTHGRSGLTRLLMGSVAEEVVRRAECPVLTVKQPHGATVNAD